MSKPSMRVFHQWEGISLQQYYTAEDYEDERLEREATHEAMKGRMARESRLFVGMKPWRVCNCGCNVWLLPGNETGRHLEADEVVQGLEQYSPKPRASAPADWMNKPVETPLRLAVSIAQIMWARSMIDQFPRKTQEQIERENSVSWKQLQHWAHSSTEGLPEKAGQKKPAKQAKPKGKATNRKAKGA